MKKNHKKALAYLLSFVMVIGLIPTSIVTAFGHYERLSYEVEYNGDFTEATVEIRVTPGEEESFVKLEVNNENVTDQFDDGTLLLTAKENCEYAVKATFVKDAAEEVDVLTITIDRIQTKENPALTDTDDDESMLLDKNEAGLLRGSLPVSNDKETSGEGSANEALSDEDLDGDDPTLKTGIEPEDNPGEIVGEGPEKKPLEVPALRGEEPTPEYLTVRIDWVADEEYAEVETKVRSRISYQDFYVFRDGTRIRTVRLNAKNNWELTAEDCPLTDEEGNPYTYRVTKFGNVTTPSYTYEITNSNGVFVDTETFRPTHPVIANVTFVDSTENYYQTLPETLVEDHVLLNWVSISNDISVQADSITRNDDGTYTIIFEDVPTYDITGDYYYMLTSDYKLEWSDVPGQYTYQASTNSSYSAINVTYKLETYTVNFTWNFSGGTLVGTSLINELVQNGIDVPERVQFTLLYNGEEVDCKDSTLTHARNANGTWSTVSAQWLLPKRDENGNVINWGDGLTMQYTPNQSEGSLPLQYTETYSKTENSSKTVADIKINFIYANVNPTVASTWVDSAGDPTGTRPDIAMTLLADGVPVSIAQPWNVSKDDSYSGSISSWQYLPQKDSNGNYIYYSTLVEGLPAYYRHDNTETLGFTDETGYGTDATIDIGFNETFTLLDQHVSADVVWVSNGEDIANSLRPDSVMVSLLYSDDDGATWNEYWGKKQYAITSAQDESGKHWHYDWILPECDEAGNPIIFKVTENVLNLYATEYKEEYNVEASGEKTTQLTVTNTYQDVPWDYVINLKWDSADPDMQLYNEVATYRENYYWDSINKVNGGEKAIVTISANMAYDVGDLTVRIPYSLFSPEYCRDGFVSEVDVGLPMAPGTHPEYAFNYTIDKHGSDNENDWEIVFSNWMPLEKGYNISISVLYRIDPYYLIDCSTAEIQAVGSGKSTTQGEPVEHFSNTIGYRLDTGVFPSNSLQKYVDSFYSSAGCIYSWNSRYGFPEEEFDPETYNYVLYRIVPPTIYFSQPFVIEFTEKPGENGRIISAYYDGNHSIAFDSETGAWRTDTLTLKDNSNTSYRNDGTAYYNSPHCYVVIAYPRADLPAEPAPGQTTLTTLYSNTIEMRAIAVDEHEGDKETGDTLDIIEQAANAVMPWTDYVFNYTGSLYSAKKQLGIVSDGALTQLEYGTMQTISTDFSVTVNGYNLTHGYSFELCDDAICASLYVNGESVVVRLGAEDYELGGYNDYYGVGITIESADIDRTNGATIAGMIPEEPFILMGQKGPGGAWEEITAITMEEGRSYYSVSPSLLNGQGYTGLKLVSPEGLKGKFVANVRAYVRVLPTSPLFQRWLEGETVNRVSITNFSAIKLYAPETAGGKYVWLNPWSQPSNNLATTCGLSAADIAENGAYVDRRSYSQDLQRITPSSSLSKSVSSVFDNKTDMTYTVRFELSALETLKLTGMESSFYQNWMSTSGTFYDLLPPGYVFDSSTGIVVYGPPDSRLGNLRTAELVSVETIDNYRDTGRQMVIFHVKAKENSNNYGYNTGKSHYVTGFQISFSAIATYEDIIVYGPGYNNAVFQFGDLRSTGRADNGIYGNIFPTDENGNYVLADINEDGDTEARNVLYAYCQVAPSILYSIQTGITKSVRANSGRYLPTDVVNPNGSYSYRVLVQTTDKGMTKDLIIYDTLERAELDSGWKGTLTGVNVSAMRQKGVDVKIYYSITAISDINEEALSLESGHWHLLQSDTDLTQVKALAFDMRKSLSGEEMVFENNSSIFVEIHMRAPDGVQSSEFAYNRPAYSCTVIQEGSEIESPMNNVGNATRLALELSQDIVFTKAYVDDTDNNAVKPLAGVTFELYECQNTENGHEHYGTSGNSSCWGNRVATCVTGEDGVVRFSGLFTGDYKVVETSAPTGFDFTPDRYWLFRVDSAKATVSDPICCILEGSTADKTEMQKDEDTGALTLINARKTKSIQVTKTWTDDLNHEIRPELTFELYRNDELYATKTLSVTVTELLFEDLPIYDLDGNAYSYAVKELETDGYQISGDAYRELGTSGTSATFINVRLGVLDVSKLVVPANQTEEFTFTVMLSTASLGDKVQIRKYASATTAEYTEEELVLTDDGLITFTLKNGERVRILGLPLNVPYTVSELAQGNYSSTVTSGSATGTTSSTSIGSVTFTNTLISHTLTYHVIGDDTYGVPADSVTPAKVEDIPHNGSVDPLADMPTTSWTTSDGTAQGVPGTWSFCEYWTEDEENPDKADITSNKVENITEDKNVYGKWVFTPYTGRLTVTKTLEGNDVDTTKEFSFTVTLSDTSITGVRGDVTFENGIAAFSLKGGESKVIERLPNGVRYTVEEADYRNDGYVTIKTGDAGTINDSVPAVASFTNTRNTYGNLTVSKTVSGNAANRTKEFNFAVTLSDTTVSGVYGGMTFEDGVATFTLKGGESKTAANLPNGIGYTVSEADYSSDGYVTAKTGHEGTIVGGETKTAAFTNTRNANGSLTVAKTLEGNDTDSSKEFTFTIELSDKTISGTYNGVTFENGVATFTLKGGESKVIEGLPNGTGYTVVEADYSNDGYTTTKNGDKGTIDENTPAVASFTNTRNTYGSLTVSKTVSGNATSRTKEFTFTVTLPGTALSGTCGDMTFEDGVATFTLKGGESKTAANLPNGVGYTVVESDNGGYEVTKSGDTGIIVGGETVTAAFTNTRNAEGSLTVTKVLKGNAADTDKEFDFTVTLSDTTISGTYSGVPFENGVATFTLKGGESKVIEGLPNGTGYTVVEANYSNDGYVTTKTGDKGTIDENTPAVASFTNTRDTYGNLTVSKTVSGNAASRTKGFTFTVTLSDTTISGTYGDMLFENGVAAFTLRGGESKIAANLPNGVGYTVVESDNEGYEVTKSGDTGIIVGDETATAAFVNTKNGTPPVTPDQPSNPGTPEKPSDPTIPKTGDDSNMLLWLGLCLASFIGMSTCIISINRKKYKATHLKKR